MRRPEGSDWIGVGLLGFAALVALGALALLIVGGTFFTALALVALALDLPAMLLIGGVLWKELR